MNDVTMLAGCILTDDYGRILLLHRNKGDTSQWELPGGKVEDDEQPEAAAIRELQEELGVSVELTALAATNDFEDNYQAYKYYCFTATTTDTPMVREPETFDDYDYIDLEDLPSLSLSTNMLALEEKLVSGEVQL